MDRTLLKKRAFADVSYKALCCINIIAQDVWVSQARILKRQCVLVLFNAQRCPDGFKSAFSCERMVETDATLTVDE